MDSFTFVLLIFIAIFGLLGLVFFLIGYLRTRKIHYFDRTEGMIIQKERHFKLNLFQLSKKQTSIHQEGTYSDENPSVAYEVGGEKYIHTSSISQQPGIPIGTKVGVYYDPYQPEKAIIDTFVQRGSLFKLLGSIFLGIAMIGLCILIIAPIL